VSEIHSIDEARQERSAGLAPTAIEIRAGELPRLVREAEDALIEYNAAIEYGAGIYQRAGQLVRIVQLEKDTEKHGIRRSAGSVIIVPLNREYLKLALARAADWSCWDSRKKKLRPCDPPGVVANLLLSASGEWRLPLLTGTVAAPTLRPDGSLLDAPGYDRASGLYATFDSKAFPDVNRRPTREEAIAALAVLRELFEECAFASGSDSAHAAVAIAALISSVVRPALPTAPAVGLSAHKMGSGKTTTAKAIAQVCTGRDPPVLAYSDDEAEFRKCLLAILIAGDSCVLIDNVTTPVDSAAFCAAITSPEYSDRVLGVNQRVIVPTATTWLITGNHLEFVGDLTTRTLLSVLDPELEHPEARVFKRDLAAYVADNRGALVAAALTIPVAYLAAGEPQVTGPRSRFAEWDRLVRRPLMWLGVPDPLDTQAELQAADPVREGLLGVLRAWHMAFKDEPTTVARATSAALELHQGARPDLYDALHAVAGERNGSLNNRRLGRYMKRNARRIEDGMRIEVMEEDRTTHRQQFRVVGVTGVSGVFYNPTREMSGGNKNIRNREDAENATNAETVCPACDGEGCNWCLTGRA
jgi:hypothetical protein